LANLKQIFAKVAAESGERITETFFENFYFQIYKYKYGNVPEKTELPKKELDETWMTS
jgi:hypothetical protein